jgi:hypothetical protein
MDATILVNFSFLASKCENKTASIPYAIHIEPDLGRFSASFINMSWSLQITKDPTNPT